MKVRFKEKIGEHTIVRFIADAVWDSEKTKRKIAPILKPGMPKKTIKQLYMDNLVPADYGFVADVIEDGEAAMQQIKLADKGKDQLLLVSNEYIADNRGVEYHIKKSGVWKKEQIEELGVSLPKGGVLKEDLTKEQQIEISVQREEERIAALTPEQASEEKNRSLHAAAREALMKAEEADLLGEIFDKQAWLLPKKIEIEKKYA